jgi:hypothetical protein
MTNKKSKINVLLIIFVYIVLGLVLGFGAGGYAVFKNRKAKEQAERPYQAEKTLEQKTKTAKKQDNRKEEIAKPAEIKEWEVFENKEYKYKIKYPKNWFISGINETPWLVNLTSYNPKGVNEEVALAPGVQVEILIQGNPKNLSLKDWVEEGHQFSGSPKVSQEIKISSLDAVREELEFEGPTVNVTFFREQDVFTVSYTGSVDEYSQYLKTFEEMIEGMEISM